MPSQYTHNNVLGQGLNIIKSAEIVNWMFLNLHYEPLKGLGVHKIVVNISHGLILITQNVSFLSPKGYVKLWACHSII